MQKQQNDRANQQRANESNRDQAEIESLRAKLDKERTKVTNQEQLIEEKSGELNEVKSQSKK